ncbi:MAG: hypothetical protein HRU09_15720 [Oligoflexales bacterium]|nr:hypothetical protein [Oligoflexales bacterium]
MLYNKILFLGLLLGLNLWSCRKTATKEEIKQENRKKLDTLLKSGKQPAAFLNKETTPSLSLSSGPVIRQFKSPHSDETTRILYNTKLMEKVTYANLESYSLKFLGELESVLQVSADDLDTGNILRTKAKDDLITLHFYRSFEGNPVKHARIAFFFSKLGEDDYRLREINNKTYGRITLANAGEPLPTDTDLELSTGLSGLKVHSSSVVIHPRITAEGMKFYFARQLNVVEPETKEMVNITLAAGTNNLLEAYTYRSHAEHKFSSLSYKRNYLEAQKSPSPLAFLPVTDDGILTDGDGIADIEPGSNPNQLTLEGERFKIINGSNLNLSNQAIFNLNPNNFEAVSLTGTTVGAETTFAADTPVEDQSLTTFRGLQMAYQLITKHLTPAQAPILNTSIATFVNAPDECNAFYFGDNFDNQPVPFMVFFSEGVTCASTGLLAGVVAHELGHALDDYTGPRIDNSGVTDPSFSEGIGDIISCYASGNPILGNGFFLDDPADFVRRCDTNLTMDNFIPENAQNFSPHFNGQIIAAAFWDMRLGFIEKYGLEKGAFLAEELFFTHLLDTPTMLTSYETLVTLDDDDGNPATPSPNLCIINEAFFNRGLTEDEIQNCVDDPLLPKSLRANLDLNFGVEADAAGTLKWVGSGEEVAQMELCFGGPDLCLAPAASTIVLPHSGKTDGRDYVTSILPANLQAYSEITIIATHYYGNKTYRTYVTSPK